MIKYALRKFLAPEAAWRRPDPVFATALNRLALVFTVPLYELPRDQREDLGRFYASVPTSAAFIVLRAAGECRYLLLQAGRQAEAGEDLMVKVLQRLFGEIGSGSLFETTHMFKEARLTELVTLRELTDLLSRVSVLDAPEFERLPDYQDLVVRGTHRFSEDPTFAGQSARFYAFLEKHWDYVGAQLEQSFDQWCMADRAQAAQKRLLRKLGI
jgi:hypothetical protein